MERVRVAESQSRRRPTPNRSAYTESEYDYMLVEVNILCRRQYLLDGARKKVPFCSYCDKDFKEKLLLNRYRYDKQCPNYDAIVQGTWKSTPTQGALATLKTSESSRSTASFSLGACRPTRARQFWRQPH